MPAHNCLRLFLWAISLPWSSAHLCLPNISTQGTRISLLCLMVRDHQKPHPWRCSACWAAAVSQCAPPFPNLAWGLSTSPSMSQLLQLSPSRIEFLSPEQYLSCTGREERKESVEACVLPCLLGCKQPFPCANSFQKVSRLTASPTVSLPSCEEILLLSAACHRESLLQSPRTMLQLSISPK